MHPLTDHLDRRCSEPVGHDDWPKADVVPGAGRVPLVSDPPSSDLLRNLRPRRLLPLAIRRNHRRLIKEKRKKEFRRKEKKAGMREQNDDRRKKTHVEEDDEHRLLPNRFETNQHAY